MTLCRPLTLILLIAVPAVAAGLKEGAAVSLSDPGENARDAVGKLKQLCSGLSRKFLDNALATSDNKSSYFKQVATVYPNKEPRTPPIMSATLPPALFVGDSIVRELHHQYQRLTTEKVTYEEHTGKQWSPTRVAYKWSFGDKVPIVCNDNGDEGLIKRILLHCSDYKIFFLSSNLLHQIRHESTFAHLTGENNPTVEQLTRAMLTTLRCLEDAAEWKGYFVGTISVEPQLLWSPAKHDHTGFGEFFLLKYWAMREQLACADMGVHLFETEALARICPGG